MCPLKLIGPVGGALVMIRPEIGFMLIMPACIASRISHSDECAQGVGLLRAPNVTPFVPRETSLSEAMQAQIIGSVGGSLYSPSLVPWGSHSRVSDQSSWRRCELLLSLQVMGQFRGNYPEMFHRKDVGSFHNRKVSEMKLHR